MEVEKHQDDINDITMNTNEQASTIDALAGPANVSDSDDKSSDGDPMDVDKNDDKLKDDFADVIDQAMLCRQMIENKKGGEKIAGKDIGLFIGETGAGKVSGPNVWLFSIASIVHSN